MRWIILAALILFETASASADVLNYTYDGTINGTCPCRKLNLAGN
jgi:hypothetical protein